MPVYSYHCPKCNKDFDEYSSVDERNNVKCECGVLAEKTFSFGNGYDPLTPYWSENMGKEPVYVESRSHRQALMKERHLEIMPYKKIETITPRDKNGRKMTQHEIDVSRTRGMFDKSHVTPEWREKVRRKFA